jgi:hypothetical protein
MPNELDPQVDQWYAHSDKGQRFYVTAVDESEDSIEVQHFDGDIEEFSFDEWRALDIELSEEPENWTGALDIGERDDLGTEITDTTQRDWNEPQEELRTEFRERRAGEAQEPSVDFNTGEAEEESER